MAQGVFTTEAARDAAITAPVKGMIVVLTAPSATGYAVTGDTYAALPPSVRTVYDGTKWVCITPLGATTSTSGTTSSITWTPTLTSGGTNPSVKLETGTQARVSVYAMTYAPGGSRQTGVSFAVTGATTLTPTGGLGAVASSLAAVAFGGYATNSTTNIYYELCRTMIITGLTAGINTFTMHYLSDSTTDNFGNRSIWVEGIA